MGYGDEWELTACADSHVEGFGGWQVSWVIGGLWKWQEEAAGSGDRAARSRDRQKASEVDRRRQQSSGRWDQMFLPNRFRSRLKHRTALV